MALVARDIRPQAERAHRDNAIEPGRLRRAMSRGWARLGPHQYRIEGRHQSHYDVNLESDVPCDCVDARMHGLLCLHHLKALIIERHPMIFDHVVTIMEAAVVAEREAAEARAAKRTSRRPRPTRARRARAATVTSEGA